MTGDPKRHYAALKAMVDYVAARMGDVGITRGEVVMAATEPEMVELLRRGRVDWIDETLFSAIRYERDAAARMMLRTWKKGVPEYRTFFFARKDGPVRALADLKGRRVALQDPDSTTAFFLPLETLREQGLVCVPLAGPSEAVPQDRVGYLMAGAEVNITAWVHRGLADAGAFSDLDWSTPEHAPPAMREELRVIHETRPVPRAVELLRHGLAPSVHDRLIEILLSAHEDPEGRRVLFDYHQTRRFDRIDPQLRQRIDELARKMDLPRAKQ